MYAYIQDNSLWWLRIKIICIRKNIQFDQTGNKWNALEYKQNIGKSHHWKSVAKWTHRPCLGLHICIYFSTLTESIQKKSIKHIVNIYYIFVQYFKIILKTVIFIQNLPRWNLICWGQPLSVEHNVFK